MPRLCGSPFSNRLFFGIFKSAFPHKRVNRQGLGGDAESEKALSLAMIDQAAPSKFADIGCGTGASTLVLARLLNAQITAVDFLQGFLKVLEGRAENMGLS